MGAVGRVLLCVAGLLLMACNSLPLCIAADASDEALSQRFSASTGAVFQRHCADCHNSETLESQLDLTTLGAVLKGAASGPVVTPGKSGESLLLQLVQPKSEPHMPPEGQLSPEEISTLAGWIDSLPADLAQSAEMVVTDEDRSFWAFRKPKPVEVPEVERVDWPLTPIDHFVLAGLETNGLSPAASAEKLDLIRRATFDLIGLPPTPDEVQSFLADESPDAYERLLDRLLASPHYGERWGRHWLDLARYADSGGFEFDIDRPYAYRYRDYVIRSFNDDKPYDRFILEQLAGDEIAPHDRDALIATGFCRNGPTVGNQENEKNRLDEMDDVVSTTSSVFLGLTVGCCRCHDHKFEPLPQRDYYRMLAIFNSHEKRELPTPEPGEAERLAQQSAPIDAQIAELKATVAKLSPPLPAMRRGQWRVEGNELVQEDATADVRLFFGDPTWTDYVIELEAQRTGGSEGVLVAFRVQDEQNFHWVNFGGWGNSQHGLETEIKGSRGLTLERKLGSMETGRWYRIRIVAQGTHFKIFLDDELVFDFEDQRLRTGGVGLGSWNTTNRWRNLKVTALDDKVLFEGLPPLVVSPADPQLQAQRTELEQKIKSLEESKPKGTMCLCIQDAGRDARPTRMLLRGDHRTPGPEVEPGVPQVLAPTPIEFPQPRPDAATTGRRTVLARWIASPDNPMTAKVMVNRVWLQHFGRGLVDTPSTFGRAGSPPSHPELLDWLALKFVADGWRIKPLHKLIMMSAVYRQASTHDADNARQDANNVWLWRFPKRRLEAEIIRDSMLQASGNLNATMYGPGIYPKIHESVIATGSTKKWPEVVKEGPEHWRRSVYIFVKRSVLMPMLEGFDAPNATQTCAQRMTTTVATQALQLMNNEFVNEQAAYMAARIMNESPDDIAAQIERAYWRALSRPPTAQQRAVAAEFIEQQVQLHAATTPDVANEKALADLCHVLFNLNEFVYVN